MTPAVSEEFSEALAPIWKRQVKGEGALEWSDHGLRFANANTSSRQYTNAQIDDYQGLRRGEFRWRPPLELSVRARFSHPEGKLQGTAGFGFWNDPFLMTERRVPMLPRALWYFYASPPSDLKLDIDVPGHGWKAAVLDALQPCALLLAPVALPAALVMNVRRLYDALWPSIQRALGIREASLHLSMTDWHTYVIEWGKERSVFLVDGEPVILDAPSPQGPLGFAMWLDNQYMVVKPWGRFGWGLLDARGRQWMEVEHLSLRPLSG